MKNEQPFLSDVQQLRQRARASLESGPITPAYKADVKQTIEILQSVLATEIVCVLRYTMNAVPAPGTPSESVKEEFDQHANQEPQPMRKAPEPTNQPGGSPNFTPHRLTTRS